MRESLVVGQVAVRRNRFNIGPCGAPRVNVGAAREKDLHHFRMFLRDSPHQRGLLASASSVDVGAFREEQFRDGSTACAGSDHQRSLSG